MARRRPFFWLIQVVALSLILGGCASIPTEVPLVLDAQSRAAEKLESEFQEFLRLGVGERHRLQSLLLSQELRNRWLAASDGQAVPLAKLVEIEDWAREERARHQREKQQAIERWGNPEGIQQQRRLNAALRKWVETRVDASELLNLRSILEAIQGRPPPGAGAVSDGLTPGVPDA